MKFAKRYRRLIMKMTTKMITRSPRPPGQTNQPPPLEYPTAKHPESPNVATHNADSPTTLADKVNIEKSLHKLRIAPPAFPSHEQR
jgi:hypothetical protein